jgi:DNA helicase-2/ATP-dependent DNA helicase PcrA
VRISTLNAYGYSMLRELFASEYRPVISPKRQTALIRELLGTLNRRSSEHCGALPGYLAYRFYTEFFSLLKNRLCDPRSLDAQAVTDFLLECPLAEVFFTSTSRQAVTRAVQAILWMYEGYERLLQRDGVLDFDDQKLRPYVRLHEQPDVLQVLQNQWDEVVVDEFQDINRLDFVLVEAIAKRATLVVTGDDDQAIYGFRGCTPEYIIDLEEHLGRQIESHELQVNYRCPPVIVEHADRLIRHNTRRIPKNPRAASDTEAQIHVVSSLSAGLEAKSIVSLIERVRSSDPSIRYRDFAVLYRTNAQSLPLQVEFILGGIPYYVRPEHSILHNEGLEALLCILRVKLAVAAGENPPLRDSVRTVCSFFRYVEPPVAARLERYFRREGRLPDKIDSPELLDLLPDKGRFLFPSAMRGLLATRSLLQTMNVIAERFYGVYGMIGSLEEVVENRVPLGEVYEIAAGFRGDTEQFVQTLDGAIGQARASKAGEDHREGVPLLTYFRSKGLQWHTVILTTCNEGLIPHQRADVEEERRLFYVAMTRASSNLVISYVNNSCACKVPPSRFLYESGLLARPETTPKKDHKQAARPRKPTTAATGDYVASVSSRVFHRVDCGAAKRIDDTGAVRFGTREEAIHSGRAPCRVCDP